MIEKLHIYITVIAALIVNVCCLVASVSLYRACGYLVATIIVFYFIGRFVKKFFIENFLPKEEPVQNSEEDDYEALEAEASEISEENYDDVKN